jgi:hypothetical protein
MEHGTDLEFRHDLYRMPRSVENPFSSDAPSGSGCRTPDPEPTLLVRLLDESRDEVEVHSQRDAR